MLTTLVSVPEYHSNHTEIENKLAKKLQKMNIVVILTDRSPVSPLSYVSNDL